MAYVLKINPRNKILLSLLAMDRKLLIHVGHPYLCGNLCDLALWGVKLLLCLAATLIWYGFLWGTMACAAYVTYGIWNDIFIPSTDHSTWGVAKVMFVFFGTCIGWMVFIVWILPILLRTGVRWIKLLWGKLTESMFCITIDFDDRKLDVPKRRGEYE